MAKAKLTEPGIALAALALISVSSLLGQAVRAPRLGTKLLETGGVTISWPGDAVGFILESRGSFEVSARWQPVSDSPAIIGNRFELTVRPAPAGTGKSRCAHSSSRDRQF